MMDDLEMKDHQLMLKDQQLELRDRCIVDLEAHLVSIYENQQKKAAGVYSSIRLYLEGEMECLQL
jgi:hypothetical protein